MTENVQVLETPASRVYQLTNVIVSLIELALAFRFILLLMGANPGSVFVSFVYTLTTPLMIPFRAVFGTAAVAEGGTVDWSILVAMLVYAILGYIINELITLLLARQTTVRENSI